LQTQVREGLLDHWLLTGSGFYRQFAAVIREALQLDLEDPLQRAGSSGVTVLPPFGSTRNWPISGLPGLLRKLTMAGRFRVSKVSLLARIRTHALGHYEKTSVMTRPWKASAQNTS